MTSDKKKEKSLAEAQDLPNQNQTASYLPWYAVWCHHPGRQTGNTPQLSSSNEAEVTRQNNEEAFTNTLKAVSRALSHHPRRKRKNSVVTSTTTEHTTNGVISTTHSTLFHENPRRSEKMSIEFLLNPKSPASK